MRQEEIDPIGSRLFALLVSILRPLGRGFGDDDAAPELEPAPPQRIEIVAGWRGERMWFDLVHWMRCRADAALVFSWLLPFPPGSAVHGLEVQCAADATRADLRERRAARDHFEQARRAGRVGALLTEDAPGFFGLELSSTRCEAVRLHLRATCPVPARTPARGGELSVHCEAGPVESVDAVAPRRSHLIRLGSGHVLDSLVGVRRETRSRAGADIAPPLVEPAADVLAAHDGADTAAAMFRGWLAGRHVRLWGKVDAPSAEAPLEEAGCSEIRRLMADYRDPARSEAERRSLAARVAEIGLEAGVATLWTSLVAIADRRGGERVHRAA